MIIIRPIEINDYDALMKCAEESGYGLTSLPTNEELLRKRIDHSIKSFNGQIEIPGTECYFFVAEDCYEKEVVGTTAIERSVGLTAPFYSYHLNKVVHSSREFNVHNVIDVLTFGSDYTGSSELCSTFLREKWRRGYNGKLLSKSRFLLMAQFKDKFSKTIFAEMRGVSDEYGNSPFWKWLQENFFSIEFSQADYLTGIGSKDIIADLMPKLPIYVNLLSKEAQAVIGKVHKDTVPALKLLEQEGFVNRGYVDIFDAGPSIECDIDNIKSLRNSQVLKTVFVDNLDLMKKKSFICSNTKFSEFRASVLDVIVDEIKQEVYITKEQANYMEIKESEGLRVLPI